MNPYQATIVNVATFFAVLMTVVALGGITFLASQRFRK